MFKKIPFLLCVISTILFGKPQQPVILKTITIPTDTKWEMSTSSQLIRTLLTQKGLTHYSHVKVYHEYSLHNEDIILRYIAQTYQAQIPLKTITIPSNKLEIIPITSPIYSLLYKNDLGIKSIHPNVYKKLITTKVAPCDAVEVIKCFNNYWTHVHVFSFYYHSDGQIVCNLLVRDINTNHTRYHPYQQEVRQYPILRPKYNTSMPSHQSVV